MPKGQVLCDVFGVDHRRADASGQHAMELAPYGYRWFRVGAPDNAVHRAPL